VVCVIVRFCVLGVLVFWGFSILEFCCLSFWGFDVLEFCVLVFRGSAVLVFRVSQFCGFGIFDVWCLGGLRDWWFGRFGCFVIWDFVVFCCFGFVVWGTCGFGVLDIWRFERLWCWCFGDLELVFLEIW